MIRQSRDIHRCQQGVALLEFALVLPLLLSIFIGTLELARYAVLQQKVDKVAYSMADYVTQTTAVSQSDLTNYSLAVSQIIKPFSFSGTVIFSSVTFFSTPIDPCTGTDVACISWQATRLGSDGSQIGTTGGNATLPADYQLTQGQNVIVAEVYFNYTPLLDITPTFIPSLAPHKLYKIAIYKPRQGTLTSLSS